MVYLLIDVGVCLAKEEMVIFVSEVVKSIIGIWWQLSQ